MCPYRGGLLAILSTSASLLPCVAMAQSSDKPERSAENEGAEIVVTAQKRSESVQRVPIAVAVATGETLASTGATGIGSLKVALPNVEVSNNVGYILPLIRGVGSKVSQAGLESPNAIYVDGVYYASTTSTLLSFSNISQVEVLKGPQGTLFGRNATGGLIQITTRDPSHTPGGNMSFTVGNYGALGMSGYVTGGISDKIAGDLAFQTSAMGDGYGTNLFNGRDVGRVQHDFGVRTKWLFEPGETTSIRLLADYSDHLGSDNVQRYPSGAAFPPGFGPVYTARPWDTDVDRQPRLRTKTGGVSLRIDQDIGNLTLRSITAWRRTIFHSSFDADYSETFVRYTDIDQHDRQFSQELELQSPAENRFSWNIGGYYFNSAGQYFPIGQILGPNGVARSETFTKQTAKSIAGFGQADFKLTDALTLTAGLRYTSERRELTGNVLSTNPLGVKSVTATVDSGKTFNKLTWRLAAAYQITPATLVYLSYNRGFKSGAFNPTALALPAVRPEVLDAYEVGFKTSFLNRRLRFNAAGFYYDYTDVQIQRFFNGQNGVFNGDKAKIYGFEAELSGSVTPALDVNVSYQYLSAKYGTFPTAVIATPRVIGGYAISSGDATGNRTVLAPKSALSVGASYRIPAGNGSVVLAGNAYYNSGFFFEPDNVLRQPSYTLFNGSIRWNIAEEGPYVTVWGRNLSNEVVAASGAIQAYPGGFGLARFAYEPPRTFGVTIGAKF